MVMSDGGELQAIFGDYLLVTWHRGPTLMSQIYDKTYVKKLKLGHTYIRNQCQGGGL